MTIETGVFKKDISLLNTENLGVPFVVPKDVNQKDKEVWRDNREKMNKLAKKINSEKKEELPKRRKKDPFYELWKYANEYNLLGKMVEKMCLTNKEIETLRNLFEGKQIWRNERKFLRLLDKFGIAIARLS